jgi:hypothetical protein
MTDTSSPPPPPSCYPARDCAPPKHLEPYHLFITMAEEAYTKPLYPYLNEKGDEADLAINDEVLMAHVCHYVMTHMADKLYLNPQSAKKQYGVKAGLKLFGDRGNSAIRKEPTQFHTLKCFAPKDPETLTREDHCNALTSLMFLTKK